jgi:hypothetical protein
LRGSIMVGRDLASRSRRALGSLGCAKVDWHPSNFQRPTACFGERRRALRRRYVTDYSKAEGALFFARMRSRSLSKNSETVTR